jgi:DNA-binding HxlR family transcriptional regulator
MKAPQPYRLLVGSRIRRPIMALWDLLGRRTSLRILWELSQSEKSLTFRELQAAAETNPSLLNTRLKELRMAGVVFHEGGGYRLTVDGMRLLSLILPLNAWSNEWARRLRATEPVDDQDQKESPPAQRKIIKRKRPK